MRDVIRILKVRWLIFRRAITETSRINRFQMALFALLILTLAWGGVGSLISSLHSRLNEEAFASLPLWCIVIAGVIVSIEGLKSSIKKLYEDPENDLLITLPIKLEHLFLERWLERLFLNIGLMLCCGIVLLQYSRLAPVSWTYALISINVILIVQQLQFLCAILYSRKTVFSLKNGLFLTVSLGAIALALRFLYSITPQNMPNSDIFRSCLLSILLLSITVLLQHLFISSTNREYQIVKRAHFEPVHALHRLFLSAGLVSFDQSIRSLIMKDIILLLRQFPLLHCLLSGLAILILSFTVYAQAGAHVAVLIGVFGVSIMFIWALFVFEFEKKQLKQMWILKTYPLSSKQIWRSKFLFILSLAGVNCILLLVPTLIGRLDLAVAGLSIGIIISYYFFSNSNSLYCSHYLRLVSCSCHILFLRLENTCMLF